MITSFTLIFGSPNNMPGTLRVKVLGGDTLGLFSPGQPGVLVKQGALVRNPGSRIDPQNLAPAETSAIKAAFPCYVRGLFWGAGKSEGPAQGSHPVTGRVR